MRATYREEPCRSALNRVTGMGFRWSLNPYTGCAHRCAFCYVRGFEQRADRPSDNRYGTNIRVKVNVVGVLRRELARRSWRHETVAVGAATDPYQPAEGRYRLTRGCIVALGEARTAVDLITRGPLIVRDIDVLTDAARRAALRVSVSIATLDDGIATRLEPGVAPPRQRLRAIRLLSEAGIAAGVALAPVLPGLTDGPAGLAAVLRAARDAGATHAWSNVLNLRPGTRIISSTCWQPRGRRSWSATSGSTPRVVQAISRPPPWRRSRIACAPSNVVPASETAEQRRCAQLRLRCSSHSRSRAPIIRGRRRSSPAARVVPRAPASRR